MNLSMVTADLATSKEQIVVYGNFSIIKKEASFPQHQVNQMDKEDFVAFFVKNHSDIKVLEESNGYKVYRIISGTSSILMATTENEVRFILGANI